MQTPELMATILGGGGIASLAAWAKLWQDRRTYMIQDRRDLMSEHRKLIEERENTLKEWQKSVRELEEMLRFYREMSIDYSVQLRALGAEPRTTARIPHSLLGQQE